MRIIHVIIAFAILVGLNNAFAGTLTGVVVDDSRQPLPGVAVAIPALVRGVLTSESGVYRLEDIPHGHYTVEFVLIGYSPVAVVAHLEREIDTLDVALHASALSVPGVTVTGTPQPLSVLESPQPVGIVDGRRLEKLRSESVMGAIENEPGVRLYTTGPSVAKPMIRGLTSQRVLVAENGIRQESQQWGDEHRPEIDPLSADRIEIVRGPASVLYGSDAMGGVVNVIGQELPSAEQGSPSIQGKFLGNLFSVSSQAAGALSLEGIYRATAFRGQLGGRTSDNVSTPNGELHNSALSEFNASGSVGWKGSVGVASIDFAHANSRTEIHEDPAEDPGATPFLKTRHNRIQIHGLLPTAKVRYETQLAWQQNLLREFEEDAAPEPVVELALNTLSAELRAHHHVIELLNGTAGITAQHQDNDSRAEEKLIPNFRAVNLAGFVYEEARFSQFTLSGGVRGDVRTLDVDASTELEVAGQTRDYSALTANAGVAWLIAPGLSLTGSVGRAWRAPTAFELFVDGVHEGTARYEIGDPDLRPEIGTNVEAGFRFLTPHVQAHCAVFSNSIDQFITLFPTGRTDPESGFDVFEHRQVEATLTGIEVFTEVQSVSWLSLRGGLDVLRGDNDRTDHPLPLMPADRIRAGLTVSRDHAGAARKLYVACDVTAVLAQDRIDPDETPSDDYFLADVGVGCELPSGRSRISVDAGVENVFDEAYRDHLSRYKSYALNPGRNITLKITVPFTLSE